MSVSRAIPALTFWLALLGAPTAHAGSPAGGVDALALPKLTLQSCVQHTTCDDGTPVSLHRPELSCTICGEPFAPAKVAVRRLCDVLKLVPLAPLPAACRAEPVQHAANQTTRRL